MEFCIGYARTDLKFTKFTFMWEINFDKYFVEQGYCVDSEIESPLFITEYREEKLKWQLIIYPNGYYRYRNYFSLVLRSSSSSITHRRTYELVNSKVHIEISTVSNESVDPIKATFVDKFMEVIPLYEHGSYDHTFDKDKLFKFSTPDEIRRNYLKNGSLILKCEIWFNESKSKSWSNSIQAVQDISASDRRLKQFDDFERILEDTKFSDVKILVDEKQFQAHKNILASRSSVFAAMFEHNMKENIESEIKIDDISYDVMKEVLRFIYAGKVNSIKDLSSDLFVAADKYNLQGLKDMCEEVLVNELSIDNICDVLGLVDHYKTNGLQNAVIQFVRINTEQLKLREEFNSKMSSLSENLCKFLLLN